MKEKQIKVDKTFLDVEETAEYLNMSVIYIRKLIYNNQFNIYKPFGKKIYIEKSEIDEIIRDGYIG